MAGTQLLGQQLCLRWVLEALCPLVLWSHFLPAVLWLGQSVTHSLILFLMAIVYLRQQLLPGWQPWTELSSVAVFSKSLSIEEQQQSCAESSRALQAAQPQHLTLC